MTGTLFLQPHLKSFKGDCHALWKLLDDLHTEHRLAERYQITLTTLKAICHRQAQVRAKAAGQAFVRTKTSDIACFEAYAQLFIQKLNEAMDELIMMNNQDSLASLESVDALDQLALNLNLPPCQMARFVLKSLAAHFGIAYNSAWMQDPQSMHDSLVRIATNGSLKQRLSFSSDWIAAQHLPRQLANAISSDAVFSPEAESLRHADGQDGERRLQKWLNEHCIEHWTEDGLKASGYPKTPDALLSVPIAILHPTSSGTLSTSVIHPPKNGLLAGKGKWSVVNWMESKAVFADHALHEEYCSLQLQPYQSRFGPGAVFYWHGTLSQIILECNSNNYSNNDSINQAFGLVVLIEEPLAFQKITFDQRIEKELDRLFPSKSSFPLNPNVK